MNISYELKQGDILRVKNCLVCSSTNQKLLAQCGLVNKKSESDFSVPFFETVACNDCTHIYRRLTPSEEWFHSAFAERERMQRDAGYCPINPSIEENRAVRYRKIADAVQRSSVASFSLIDRVIDFGCGPGTGLLEWKRRGKAVLGVEPDETRASYAQSLGVQVEVSTWQDYDADIPKKTLVTSIQSLEHFYDPLGFLRHIANLSNEDTIFYIEVPNAVQFIKNWNDATYLAHQSNFTAVSLLRLLTEAGLQPLEWLAPYELELDFSVNENLCLLAKRREDSTIFGRFVDDRMLPSDVLLEMHRRYMFQPDSEELIPDYYQLPDINDLSLGYKRDSVVLDSVAENYELRDAKKAGRVVIIS